MQPVMPNFGRCLALTCLLLVAGPGPVPGRAAPSPAPPVPAFLDAADTVNVWMDRGMDAAEAARSLTVRIGGAVIPLTRVEVLETLSDQVVLAGTFQSALGGTDWQPNGLTTRMREIRPGLFALVARLPAGRYEYKVARGGTWDENYGRGFERGGANLSLTVPAGGALVRVEADFKRRTILNSLDAPAQVPPPTGPLPVREATRTVSRHLRLSLGRRLGPDDIWRPLSVQYRGTPSRPLVPRDALDDPQYFYPGDDLGARPALHGTGFKVWSPVASAVDLLLYPSASGPPSRILTLRRQRNGVWAAAVSADLHGVFYQYRLTCGGVARITPDVYCRAASADGRRSVVVDWAQTDPPGWSKDTPPALAHPTDAVVYELHLRDFTGDPSVGLPPPLRGTYRGLVAPGSRVPGTNAPTGLDYLRRLGVTHVQVMPFQSFNPATARDYAWGYGTHLFDVPERQYASDPPDPLRTIRDVKAMTLGLHRAGLGLVMDVVYNHTGTAGGDSPFQATVPGYFFRTGPDGRFLNDTGVGNTVDDEHPMVRKFILDSLLFWQSAYHVDGFRFDLLGVFTPATVRALAATLHRSRPDALLYGEPWAGSGAPRYGKGAQRGLGIGVFNDNFRQAVRGDTDGTAPGFALGGHTPTADLQTVLSGSPDFADAPGESVNFVSVHDNQTLWDKIQATLPTAGPALQRRALTLAGAMVLLSQGVPFLEGGAEMGRTKGGNANSYNAGDAVNRFDWRHGLAFAPVSDAYRDLIALRRAHPAFRLATRSEVAGTLAWLDAGGLPPQTVAFTLDGARVGDSWAHLLVVFHGGTSPASLTLPEGDWKLALNGGRPLTPAARVLTLEPLSAYVLHR